MTNFELITPFIFGLIFIVLHFYFQSKRNKKTPQINPEKNFDNYEIIKINSTHFAVIYRPLMLYIYITPNNESVLTQYVFSNALMLSEIDAFNYLENYINNL